MTKTPKMVELHYQQMVNTMELLRISKFATLTIPPTLKTSGVKDSSIYWSNARSNEGVNASNFSFIQAYEKVLSNRSFQVLLFDNSILRCSLNFSDDILISQNFSWIPCPLNCFFDYSFEDMISLEPELISERITDKSYSKESILLRSTIRFDYDSENDTIDHPSAHIHLQNPETRIYIQEPICFNSFVKHIIKTYYPESYYVKKNLIPKKVYDDINLKELSGLSFKTIKNSKKQSLKENRYYFEKIPMG